MLGNRRILRLAGLVAGCVVQALGTPLYEVRDLGTLGGAGGTGFSINGSGQVAGRATTAGGDPHAFLYTSQTMRDLGVLGGGLESQGNGINASGQVAGTSYVAGSAQATLWLRRSPGR